MSKVKIQGNASGTGVLTVTAPNTDTDRTITLPDGDVTMGVGIDDNANATAMTIDSSENVLVGKTSSDTGNSLGFEARQNGLVNIGRDGGEPLLLNRNTSDGDIMLLRKNGTTVGSIGVTSSDQLYIARTTGSQGIKFKNSATMPCSSSGNDADNAQDLGSSSVRWKDLYLSGGLKVGGTDAAHTLDDYEEGTWTPTLSGTTGGPSGVNFDYRTGWYTKIGRQVTASWIIGMSSWSAGPSGNALISGLPFSAMTGSNFNMSPVIGYSSRFNDDNAPRGGFVESGATVVRLLRSAGTSSRNNVNTNVTCSGLGGDEYIYGQVTYFTA